MTALASRSARFCPPQPTPEQQLRPGSRLRGGFAHQHPARRRIPRSLHLSTPANRAFPECRDRKTYRTAQASPRCSTSRVKKCAYGRLRSSNLSSTRLARWQCVGIVLTNSRQGVAHKHVNDPAAAVSGGCQHGTGGLLTYFADDDRFRPAIRLAHCIERHIGILG